MLFIQETPSESANKGPQSSQTQAAISRVSPEKRKQPAMPQDRRIFKSKVSRTFMTKNASEEKMDEEEGCTQIRCAKAEKEVSHLLLLNSLIF